MAKKKEPNTVPKYTKIRRNVHAPSASIEWSDRQMQQPQCSCVSSDPCVSQCYNRMCLIECDEKTCPCGSKCMNREIQPSQFIIEYRGEVIDEAVFQERLVEYKTHAN